jgi:Phosphotransferase enzyme family
MRPVSLPEVPYGATAVRPGWSDLPPGVREVISSRLGGQVIGAASAGGGFTRAFAAVLTTGGGDRAFVKAAPLDEPIAGWYAREAAVTAALPAEVRAARPRWTLAEAGYFVLCLEAVDGHVPELPWRPHELDAAVHAWQRAASALAGPHRADDLPRLSGLIRDHLSPWSRGPVPDAPTWANDRVPDLRALERALPGLVDGNGMLHGDLRVDNILIDGAGDAWLCDWTWPCVGQPWFDTVSLLVTAYASGLDIDHHLAGAPPDGVDGALAVLGGYWLVSAAAGPSSASPHSRQHQRFSGRAALAWLAERRGWA